MEPPALPTAPLRGGGARGNADPQASRPWRPRFADSLELQEVLGDLLVLDRRHERVHRLNPTAAEILRDCDGSRTVSDLIERLAAHHGIDRNRARADVVTLLERSSALGLIE